MKLKFTYVIFLFAGVMTFMMSHSGGRAAQFNEGNTGAPGDDSKTCGTCHSGGAFGADIVISLVDQDGNEVTAYQGGQTYTVNATINTTVGPGGYGLQMVGLVNSDNSNAGAFANPSTNAQLSVAGARTYLEQAGLSAMNVFSTEWTAPSAGAGSVTFYAAGHAADGNGQTTGDQAVTASFEFEESIVESTIDLKRADFTISPNPVLDRTTIQFESFIEGTLYLSNAAGQYILTQDINGTQHFLDVSSIIPGTYSLSVMDKNNQKVYSKQLIKI